MMMIIIVSFEKYFERIWTCAWDDYEVIGSLGGGWFNAPAANALCALFIQTKRMEWSTAARLNNRLDDRPLK